LGYIFKDIVVQHPPSVTPIQPFHKRILRGSPRLYVLELDIVHHAPFRGDPAYKFTPVVHPYLFWLALFVAKVVEYPDHAVARQGEVNLNMECLSVKIINYIKCPKASFVLYHVCYKIHTPGMVELAGDLQGLFYSGGQ